MPKQLAMWAHKRPLEPPDYLRGLDLAREGRRLACSESWLYECAMAGLDVRGASDVDTLYRAWLNVRR